MRSNRLSNTTLAAALLVGTTTWLSFGVLGVLDSHSTRVGILPPFALLGLTIALAVGATAALQPSWHTVGPLFLSLILVLPWLPLPVPAQFLIWTGPSVLLVWAGILLIFLGALSKKIRMSEWRSIRDAYRAPRVAAVLAFVVFVAIRLGTVGPPGGDEPHYLVIAQSLLRDGDIRIANNYKRGDHLEYWTGRLFPHFSQPSVNGELYSVHAPGVPALVAPAFQIGGYWAVVLWIAALVSVGSAFVWKAGYILTRDAGAAWFGWSAVVLTTPVALHGTLVYPDPIGGAILGGGTYALLIARARLQDAPDKFRWSHVAQWLLAGMGVGLLPWLHTRLALPAAFLGCLLVLRLGLAIRRQTASRMELIAFVLPAALSVTCWFMFFRIVYGTFDPSAPYGQELPVDMRHVVTGLIALAADQEFGLLPNAPIHLLWGAGLWSVFKRDRYLASELLLITVPYAVASSGYPIWYAGASPPARFLVPVVFPIGIALAALWAAQVDSRRSITLALLGLSVLISAILGFGGDGSLAYNDAIGRARWLEWIAPLVDLPAALPSAFRSVEGLAPQSSGVITYLVNPVLMWTLSAVTGMVLFRLLVSRIPGIAPFRAVLATSCLLVVIALGTTATWNRAQETSVTSTRSQLRLLRADTSHRPLGVLLPGIRFIPADAARTHLVLSASRLDPPRNNQLLYLPELPPGDYQLRVRRRADSRGMLFVGIGRSSGVAWQWPVSDSTNRTMAFHLPILASSIVVNGDADAIRSVESVTLVPGASRARISESAARARDAVRYGDVIAFAVDDRVVLEPEGFWVLGERQPEVVFLTVNPINALDLEVRNVSIPNQLRLSTGRWSIERALEPDEVWHVRVPVLGLGPTFRVEFKVDRALPARQGELGCRVVIR